ncbi:MAG: hypothetical protein E3K36_16405 [Candidatus Brocadia sp.]|nr:hypothetical protein [Candidatus Brocadia sp.]
MRITEVGCAKFQEEWGKLGKLFSGNKLFDEGMQGVRKRVNPMLSIAWLYRVPGWRSGTAQGTDNGFSSSSSQKNEQVLREDL